MIGIRTLPAPVTLALTAICVAALVAAMPPALFAPYFGPVPAPLAIAVTVLSGGAMLPILQTRGFPEKHGARADGIGVAVLLAGLFGIVVIAADIALHFPRDLNAPAPWALLFYPVMGLVAEVVFHLAPLTIVLLVATQLTPAAHSDGLWRVALLLAALTEPLFQALHAGDAPALTAFTALHVLAFSLCQLWLFRNHGFATMYAMRLVYYLEWHIAWGTARLELLF